MIQSVLQKFIFLFFLICFSSKIMYFPFSTKIADVRNTITLILTVTIFFLISYI